MKLSIKTDFADVQRAIKALPAHLQDRVMVRTINRTMDQAKTAMVREIRSEYAVTAGYVRERLVVRRARVTSSGLQAEAVLAAGNGRQRAANVIAFTARQVKGGVSIKVRRSGGRKLIRGAFIGNKGRTVFARQAGTTMASRSKYRGSAHAERIGPVSTIDVPQMFNARRINGAVVRVIEQKLSEVAAREIRFALQAAGFKA
jgi:hypothetical protein